MAGEVVTAQPGSRPGARPGTGTGTGVKGKPKRDEFSIGSQRREYKLMQVVAPTGEGGEPSAPSGSNIKPIILVKAAKTGKVRPLTDSGRFADRPKPSAPPPPWVDADAAHAQAARADVRALEAQAPKPGGGSEALAMPFVYASEANKLVLTRGQFLELSEAKAKQVGVQRVGSLPFVHISYQKGYSETVIT
jgi:hypothetical protein